MDRIARVIVEYSKRILALTGAVTFIALLMLFRMDFNADVASFVLEGNETGRELVDLQDKYTTADPINVLISFPEGESFLSPEGLATLAQVRDDLVAIEGVEQVASLVPEANPLTGEPLTGQQLAALPAGAVATLVGQNPTADLFVSEDGRHALIMVVPGDESLDVAQSISAYVPPAEVEIVLSGNPVVFAEVLDILSFFLLIIPPIVMILLVGTFYATIGDLRLSVLALIPAALGSIWTFGLIFGLGLQVDIVTVIVPIFVIVMGSADGLHFVTHFQEEAAMKATPADRVSSALRQVGVPMILTTISTAAGFLSLLVTDVQPIRQLGAFVAIGIVFAGIISFFSLPALISRLTISSSHHRALIGPRVTAGLKRLVKTRTPALVLTGGIVVFALVGIPQLAVDSDQLFFFKDDHPIREAFEQTEELFGGATPLAGEFAYDPVAGPEQLAAIQKLSRDMEELPGVRRVFSAADLAGTLPPEQLAAVLEGEGNLPLGTLATSDGMRFMLLPSGFSTDDLQQWKTFAANTPEIVVLTGMPIVWDEIARLVLRAQVSSIIVAFVLVTIMLAISYRKLRETLVALVPILLTVATLLAFIALSGIQLNLLTAIVSSIVIGVGIDYSIHFVAAITYAQPEGNGYVLRAIDRAGRPIVANALGIAIALSALWLSPLKIHGQVSMIMWVAMITAAATALLVIPAFLPRAGVVDPADDVELVAFD
jgi:predicted RND superfamily exporter protein